MKKSTGIVFRLVIVVAILAVFVAVFWVVYKMTNPNEYNLTNSGMTCLDTARKAFASGDKAQGFSELEKGREFFRRAVKVNPKFFKPHDGLAKSWMLEFDNRTEADDADGSKRQKAMSEAVKSYQDVAEIAPWHLDSMVELCRIADKYMHDSAYVRRVADIALKFDEKRPVDPSKETNAAELKVMRLQLHRYLGKSIKETSQKKLVDLIYAPSVGNDAKMAQRRRVDYAEIALELKKAEEEFKIIVNASRDTKLPADVTLPETYLTLGEIELHLLDCYWQILAEPGVNFDGLDRGEIDKRKKTYSDLGILVDKENNKFKELSALKQEIAEKTTNTKADTPVDAGTVNYFDLARKAAEDDVAKASGADADKAKTVLENLLIAVGRGMCVFGIGPRDPNSDAIRPGETFLDDMRSKPAVNKTEAFYIQYATLLANINKRPKALEVLQEGIKQLNTTNLHLALGHFYSEENKFLEAKNEFVNALATDKENKDARYELASLYVKMAENGNRDFLKDAAEHVDWLISKFPNNPDIMELKGMMHMQNPVEYDKATEIFEQIYQMGGENRARGAYLLGLLYRIKDDRKRAEEYLTEAKKLRGVETGWGVYFYLAALYVNIDNQKALGLCKEYYDRAQKDNRPVEPQLLRIMGRCLGLLGQKEEASKIFNEAIKRGIVSFGVDKGLMLLSGLPTQQNMMDAWKAFDMVTYAEADLPTLKKSLGAYYGMVSCVLMLNKDNRDAASKGALKILEENMGQIRADLEQALKSGSPDEQIDAKNKYQKYMTEVFDACNLASKPDRAKMETLVKNMTEIAPTNPETLRCQAVSRHFGEGIDTGEAMLQDEDSVIKLLAGKTDQEQADITRNYAESLAGTGHMDKAEEWYGRVLKIYPDDLAANGRLAQIMIEKRSWDKADEYIKKLEGKYRDNQEVIFLRLDLESAREPNIDKKIQMLRDAIKVHSDMSRLHFRLATAYEEKARGGPTVDPKAAIEAAIGEYGIAFSMSFGMGGNAQLAVNIARARLTLARMLTASGDAGGAKAQYAGCELVVASLCDKFPANADYKAMLAECRSALAKDDTQRRGAVALYQDALDAKKRQLTDAEVKTDQALTDRLKSDIYYIYNNVIPLLKALGDTETAKKYSAEMMTYAYQPRERFGAVISAARLAEVAQTYDEAYKIYQDGLDPKKEPEIGDNKDVYAEMVRQLVLFCMRRQDGAESIDEKKEWLDKRITALDKGLAFFKDAPPPGLIVIKADILWRQGEYVKAKEMLGKAEKAESEKAPKDRNPNFYIMLALFNENKGAARENLVEAEKFFLQAVDVAPEQDQQKVNLVDFYLRHINVFKGKAQTYITSLGQDKALWLVMQGRLAAATGDVATALAKYRQATEKDSGIEMAYLNWRDALLQKSPDAIEEAIIVLKNGLAANPLSLELKTALGLLYFSKNDAISARTLFKEVLAVDKRDLTALQGVASLASRDLSDPEFSNRADTLDAAVDAIEKGLYALYPNDIVSQRLMGILRLYQGEPKKAIDHFKQAYAMGQDSISLAILSHLALDRQTIKIETADLKKWATGLAGWKEDTALQIFAGRCMLKSNEEGAEANFKTAAAMGGDEWAQPYVFIDVYYQNRAIASMADDAFEQCFKRLKNSVDDMKDCARIYVEAGYPDRAIQLLQRAAKSADERKDDRARNSLDALCAFIYLYEKNDAAKAQDLAQKVLDSAGDQKYAEAMCVVGKIMCDKGKDQIKEGIKILKDAIQADRNNPRCHAALAEAYYQQFVDSKNSLTRADAETEAKTGIRLDPYGVTAVNLYLLLGDCYFADGKKKEARDAYSKFLGLGGQIPKDRKAEIEDRMK